MRLNNNDVQLKRENRHLGILVRSSSSRSGQCSRISSVRIHSVTIAPFEVSPYPQEVLYNK